MKNEKHIQYNTKQKLENDIFLRKYEMNVTPR